jgi:hypothetical protein
MSFLRVAAVVISSRISLPLVIARELRIARCIDFDGIKSPFTIRV